MLAQRGDLLHDVAGEQHAAARLAQLEDQFAQRPGGHHVEPVARLVEQHVLRLVYQRAGERHLGALPLGEALAAAVGEIGDLQKIDNVGHALLGRALVQAAEAGVIADVLARGQMRIQSGAVRQSADAPPRGERLRRDVDAVDPGAAGIGSDDGVEHAQRRRLARAVRAEQARDPAVGRREADAADGAHLAEGFVYVLDFDHGDGPDQLKKNGITKLSSMQAAAPSSSCAAATKSATTSGMQPTGSCP